MMLEISPVAFSSPPRRLYPAGWMPEEDCPNCTTGEYGSTLKKYKGSSHGRSWTMPVHWWGICRQTYTVHYARHARHVSRLLIVESYNLATIWLHSMLLPASEAEANQRDIALRESPALRMVDASRQRIFSQWGFQRGDRWASRPHRPARENTTLVHG
jgi:hypothetical protein